MAAAEAPRMYVVAVVAAAIPTPYYSRKPHATAEEIARERAEDVYEALMAAGLRVIEVDVTGTRRV